MKKTQHCLYAVLLILSVGVVLISLSISSTTWNAIVMSIGCGGIASVIVAWLIDWRNYSTSQKENNIKYTAILRQYVKLYQRLMRQTLHECHGLYRDNAERSLREWFLMLSDENRYADTPQRHSEMLNRCNRITGSLLALQKYIENFQIQSATLILNDFPEIEEVLEFFEVQHVYAWGSLDALSHGDCKTFCETTPILYAEFLKKFPQYKENFPEKYNYTTLKEWKL